MKLEIRTLVALLVLGLLMVGTSSAATLNVSSDTLDSTTYTWASGSEPETVEFKDTGLGVTATGQNFLVLSSFTTSNSAEDYNRNRQGRWQIATDYSAGDYTYTEAQSVTGSAIYQRWISGKSNPDDRSYGSANMNGIYSFASSGSHSFDLYHRTNAGADIVTQDGSMVVVGLDVGNSTLPYGTQRQDFSIGGAGPDPFGSETTSTSWSRVEKSSGVELGATIDISDEGGKIFVAASLNTSQSIETNLAITGQWQLVLCDSNGDEVERLGTSVRRSIQNTAKDSGVAMLYAVSSDLSAAEYSVRLEQKVVEAVSGQGISTYNASINAVGLTIQDGENAGEYFEDFGATVASVTNSTDTFSAALTVTDVDTTDSGIVAGANFTSEGSAAETGQMKITFDTEEFPLVQRTISGSGKLGAAGSVGYIASGNGEEDLELMFAHTDATDTIELSLYDPNMVGFYAESVPEPATMCLLAIGGAAMLMRRKRK